MLGRPWATLPLVPLMRNAITSPRICRTPIHTLSALRRTASIPTTSKPFSSTSSRLFSSTNPSREQRQREYVRFGSGADPQRPWDVSKWDTQMKVVVGVALACGVYYVAHLEQVPETGRWRFMDVGPKLESELAAAARKELKEMYGAQALPANHPLTVHVRRVVTRILEANNLGTLKSSGRPVRSPKPDDVWDPDGAGPFGSGRTESINPGVGGHEWELMVVNDDKFVNAMVSFDDIVVFTGILPVARDEEGLAAILGHEIAHAVARHHAERVSSSKVALAAVSVLAVVGLDWGFSNLLSNLLLELPNGRRQEYEADQIGLRLMSKACYDPRASPTMFARFAKLEEKMGHGRSPGFLKTHPPSKERVERLTELLPQAYQIQAESPDCARIRDNLSAFQDTFTGAFGERSPQPVVAWRYA